MTKLMRVAGNVLGLVGTLICLAAGLTRLTGTWTLLGYECETLFFAGIGLMLVACLALLQVLIVD